MTKLRVLDLFSGIGGFSLGLERTGGFETVAFCEIDPFCRSVLAKHWPDVASHDDVTQYEFKEGEADVITAGFPCQDISFAGDGAGLAGARSGLYREVIRAIRMVRPKFAVLENVAALLSRGMGTVLGDLAEVGHDAEWHCIPASAVGAPHRRDRIWIVTNPGGEQHESRSAPFSGALAEELLIAHAQGWGKSEFPEGDYGRPPEAPRQVGFVAGTSGGMFDGRGAERMQDCERIAAQMEKPIPHTNSQHVQGLVPGSTDEKEREGSIGGQTGSCGDGIGWWAVEPDVGRVANGVPNRAHRLRALGNAVVPQIPEMIGRAILASRQAA